MGAYGLMPFGVAKSLLWFAARFIASRRGNIGILTAILIVPVVGALGLATEGASWYLVTRAAQTAADAAAIAAAVNADSSTYQSEGKAVASNYGFTDGANHDTVTITTVASPSPCDTTTCYEVTVTKVLPLALTRLVGYAGDSAYGSGRGQTITAKAVATVQTGTLTPCIFAYGNPSGGKDIVTFDGTPGSNLSTCTLMANGNVACNGQNGGGGVTVVSSGTVKGNGCTDPETGAPKASDPFLATYQTAEDSLPSNPMCTSPPQEANGGTTTQLSGTITSQVICGDAVLTGDLTASGTLEIDNGVLDLNGYKLTGNGLTIVFSGPDTSGAYNHYLADSANKWQLDITAPDSGSWEGVAIWQDPNIPDGSGTNQEPKPCSGGGSALDTCFSGGSNPSTVNISGLVYLSKANVTISGDIGAGSVNCFVLVANTFTLNGTGGVYSYPVSQCANLNLTLPTVTGVVGAKLIF